MLLTICKENFNAIMVRFLENKCFIALDFFGGNIKKDGLKLKNE